MIDFVKDIDGNEYPVRRFGNQIWMTANLKVRHFRNGDPIPECRDSIAYSLAGQKGNPAWCYYDNLQENGDIYGSLYNWFAAHDVRGVAPDGWRIPTEDDWSLLELNLKDKSITDEIRDNKIPSEITGKLSSDFNPLPGGSRGINGAFGGLGINCYWWSFISNPPELSWGRKVSQSYDAFEKIDSFQRFGFSIRCIKDVV